MKIVNDFQSYPTFAKVGAFLLGLGFFFLILGINAIQVIGIPIFSLGGGMFVFYRERLKNKSFSHVMALVFLIPAGVKIIIMINSKIQTL